MLQHKVIGLSRYKYFTVIMICIFVFIGVGNAYANVKSNELEVKNEKCSLKYEIADMKLEKGILSLRFNINEKESKNVYSSRLVVKDDKGRVLTDTPEEAEGYYNQLVIYKADISREEIKSIDVVVYAFPEKFEFMDDVDMKTIPSNKTTYEIKFLKDKSNEEIPSNKNVVDNYSKIGSQIIKKKIVSVLIILLIACTYLIFKNKKKKGRKYD